MLLNDTFEGILYTLICEARLREFYSLWVIFAIIIPYMLDLRDDQARFLRSETKSR